MENQIRENLTEANIWTRLVYMVLVGIAYAVAETVFILVAIFQFMSALFTRQVNAPLLTFASNLSWYIYQIVQFQTFNSEEKPFPFSDWPNKPPGETPWSEESEWSDSAEPSSYESEAQAKDTQAEASKDHETVMPPKNKGAEEDRTNGPES